MCEEILLPMKLKRIRFLPLLASKVAIYIPKVDINKALTLILKENLSYIRLSLNKNDEYEIEIYASLRYKYQNALNSVSIKHRFGNEYGIMCIFKKNKHRLGIFVGLICMLLIAYISTKLVWRINITGNIECSDEEIIELVSRNGLSLGTFIPGIDYDDLHNKILLSTDKLSWISINICGSVANIEVKETKLDSPSKEILYTNVVSNYDAQIVSVKTLNGEEKVHPGDIVKKGDILISGVLDSQSEGIRYLNAEGEIYAYVKKQVVIEIPRDEVLKTSEKVHTDKSIKIFSNIINFSLKHSNCDEFCDKIKKTEVVKLFNTYELPVSIITTKHYSISENTVTHSNQEMVDLAFIKLKNEINSALNDAELISKDVKTYYKDDTFYIECELYCLENIAKEVQFFREK